MKIHIESTPHPKKKNLVNLCQPYDRLSQDHVLASKQPWGGLLTTRQLINFTLVFIWLILLPFCAMADQCVEGDCVNGQGTMIYSTGHKYIGEFENGMRDGHGFLIMPGNQTLEGHFLGNDPIEGTYTYSDGKIYTGKWQFHERNGWGTLKYPDGRFYEGEFKSGLRNGKGVMVWPDGRCYVGDFLRGHRTGKGIMIYRDGRVYTGDFLDGEWSGSGVLTFPHGERLGGQFVYGKYAIP